VIVLNAERVEDCLMRARVFMCVCMCICVQLAKVIEEVVQFQTPSYSIIPDGAVSYL